VCIYVCVYTCVCVSTYENVVCVRSEGYVCIYTFVCVYIHIDSASDRKVQCESGRGRRRGGQKRPTTVSKETYYSVKRDLLQCQKRPTTVSKETYYTLG